MPRILVADNHAIFRKRVVKTVAASIPSASVDEAEDGQIALAMVNEGRYDLVFLGISMPGRGGFEVLRKIKFRRPGVPVLILSMYPEKEYAMRALHAGASGYVAKESAAEELAEAIRKVLAGGRYVSASLTEKLTREKEPNANRVLRNQSNRR